MLLHISSISCTLHCWKDKRRTLYRLQGIEQCFCQVPLSKYLIKNKPLSTVYRCYFDLLCWSSRTHVSGVLELLRKHQFNVKGEMCEFQVSSVSFLNTLSDKRVFQWIKTKLKLLKTDHNHKPSNNYRNFWDVQTFIHTDLSATTVSLKPCSLPKSKITKADIHSRVNKSKVC